MLLQLLFAWVVQDIMSGVEDTSEQTMPLQKEEVTFLFRISDFIYWEPLNIIFSHVPVLYHFGNTI